MREEAGSENEEETTWWEAMKARSAPQVQSGRLKSNSPDPIGRESDGASRTPTPPPRARAHGSEGCAVEDRDANSSGDAAISDPPTLP